MKTTNMKRSHLFVLLLPVFILFGSCRKEKDCSCNPPARKGNLIRIQQGISANLANDTVKLISYDSLNRIRTVVDSIYKDTMYAYYDASGRLSRIVQIRHDSFNTSHISTDSARFTYNATGLLVQYDFTNAGEKDRYIFEYNNGVLTKNNFYLDAGRGGPLFLWRTFTYEVTGGNITDVKEYTTSNSLVNETKYTYGPQLNPFKDISLFNFANKLGTDEVISYETYFNHNILTGYTNNAITVNITNLFNDLQKPAKIVSMYDFYNGKEYNRILTRFFTYN
jgi:hypothetical protein